VYYAASFGVVTGSCCGLWVCVATAAIGVKRRRAAWSAGRGSWRLPRRAKARVDTGAIERNCARLAALAPLCAVVKADGYGHGAVEVARAAQRGGTAWLAVATAEEAARLRAAGIGGPLLVLGALSPDEFPIALEAGTDVVAWREEFVAALPRDVGVHVKLDTGMGRLSTRDPEEASRVAAAAGSRLAGAMTHLERFLAWADGLGAMRHAANSAAAIACPAARLGMIRCGVAIYGIDPFHRDPSDHGLEALELVSYVAEVKRASPGESTGYGRRFIAQRDRWVATIPIGYGDGVRRGLTGDVLVGGRRVPLAGTISMEQHHPRPRRRAGRARHGGRADRRARRRAHPGRGLGRRPRD
jgi:alanine racemase